MLEKGNKDEIGTLSLRYILGIEPICPVFKTYWTACFFNEIIKQGPDQFKHFLANVGNDGYVTPT